MEILTEPVGSELYGTRTRERALDVAVAVRDEYRSCSLHRLDWEVVFGVVVVGVFGSEGASCKYEFLRISEIEFLVGDGGEVRQMERSTLDDGGSVVVEEVWRLRLEGSFSADGKFARSCDFSTHGHSCAAVLHIELGVLIHARASVRGGGSTGVVPGTPIPDPVLRKFR